MRRFFRYLNEAEQLIIIGGLKTQVSQRRKEKIFRDAYYAPKLPKSKDFEDSIEKLAADVWEDVTHRHIPEMIVDMESLEYVPRKIRLKLAAEPLFISRYE